MKRARRPSPPLSGQRVLVTRARRQAGTLAALLRRQGATVLEIPSIEIRPPRSYRPLDQSLRRITEYDWLVLTSVNGVEALFARLKKLRLTARQFRGMRIAAIGPATRAAIEKRGLRVQVMPREYVAESVVQALRGKVKGKRVLLVRAKVARDVLPRELRKAGARVDVIEAYETVVPARSRRRLQALLRDTARHPHVITFTSSSTARNFMELLGRKRESRRLLDGITAASIGPVTSATLRELGLRPGVQARRYTMPGLVAAIVAAQRS